MPGAPTLGNQKVGKDQNYRERARESAAKYGVDPDIFVAQINQESGFDPNARSSAGATGIAQFMPGTAKALGINPNNPIEALDGAARHMGDLLKKYNGDYKKALAAYNAGAGAVDRYKGVPPFAETRNYVDKILAAAKKKDPIAAAGDSIGNAAGDVADVVTAPIDAMADVISPIGHFFANLVEPAFWLRVGKVILGVLFLAFALRRLA